MSSVVESNARGWHSSMMINRGAAKDLALLQVIIQESKGIPFEMDTPTPIMVNSDASLEGYGVHAENYVMVGRFFTEEHINLKELRTLLEFFTEAERLLLYPRGRNFEIRGDNTTAISYLRKGYGIKDNLSQLAREIWTILRKNNWWISKVIYIPSTRNVLADRLSRLGDWQSSQELIDLVEKSLVTTQ